MTTYKELWLQMNDGSFKIIFIKGITVFALNNLYGAK